MPEKNLLEIKASNNKHWFQTATLLTLYLENFTSFFEYLPSRVPYPLSANQLRLFAAAIIFRSMGQLVCNGHATLSLCTIEEGNSEYLLTGLLVTLTGLLVTLTAKPEISTHITNIL